jgi:Flp pilus assembly protein TadD
VDAAREEVRARPNGATLSQLAWCLYRAGRTREARETVRKAFALGARDPVLVERARMIQRAGGGR